MIAKPFIIFIDTSIFESENFFLGRNLKNLCDLSKDNIVELKITNIVYEELKQRIKANILKSQISTKKSLQTLNGDGKILKNIKSLQNLYSLLNIDFHNVEIQLLKKLDDFLKEFNFEIINSNISDVNEVFNNYFNTKPPFKDGAKKNEFPDAFSINTIKKWAEKNYEKVIFLTNDSDFLEISIKNIDNTHTISTLLDHIARQTHEIHIKFIEDQNIEYDFGYEIREALEKNYTLQLKQALEEDIFFYADLYDPEIDDLENFYATIDSMKINSIEQNKKVVFETTSSISFDTKLSYYEILNAFYDKEDDEWYGKEPKIILKSFSANVICLIEFHYNINDDFFHFNKITSFEVKKIEEI